MVIIIKNWTTGETSNCRLAVVRGCVAENSWPIVSENDDILVTYGTTVGLWPVHNGHFKAVVELERGVNDVRFKYKEEQVLLTLRLVVHNTELCVVPLYVVCDGHDGRFQAPEGTDNSLDSACRRIALGAHLVQSLYAEKLLEKGLPRKTFQVENDLDPGSPTCRVLHSQLTMSEARKLKQEDLWEFIGREIMTSPIASEKRKYLAILSCTFWDGTKVVADPALGGGGLALLGSGTLHTWPESLSQLIHCFTDQRKMPPGLQDNSCFRGTFAGCLSTSLGSVCHEVGHMFNLGHTPTGIMSRGFDNVERVFLSVPSPQVKGCAKVDDTNNLILVPCLSISSSTLPTVGKPERASCPASETSEDDFTSFTSACAAILAHHKWFNNETSETSTVTYDPIRNLVSSEAGLKVVQLRGSSGSVIKSWELGSKSPHKHLILPRLKVPHATLVAINSFGSILSQQI
uniref:Putative zinc metalloproteinase C607.06c n=1 Tax=Lygus hesperus TaxID=30085 RepID=A0A146KZX5_LYGHE